MAVNRNTTHAVGFGERCNGLGQICRAPMDQEQYQCVTNPDADWNPEGDGPEPGGEIIAADDNAFDLVTSVAVCSFAAGLQLSIDDIGLQEGSLGLLTDADLQFDF